MILRLLREQLRSMWTYTAWSAGLLAFALALATYAMATAATQFTNEERATDVSWGPSPGALYLMTYVDGHPAYDVGESWVVPVEAVDPLIAEARLDGPLTAARQVQATAPGMEDGNVDMWAFATPVSWDRYLLEGRAPGRGEIVLSARVATALGVAVNDSLTLYPPAPTPGLESASRTFAVVGISRDGDAGPYRTFLPGAFISWDDSVAAVTDLQPRNSADGVAVEWTDVQTILWWDGERPTLAPYSSGADAYSSPLSGYDRVFRGLSLGPTRALVVGAVTLACLVLAAFGMGRAQGQARTRWTASARVMGATRRAIAATSALETAVLAVAGIAVGFASGLLFAALGLALTRATHPDAYLPDRVSVPPLIPIIVAATGIVISVIVAAVPAFWASRVAPVAALKPVTPVTEASLSRRVSRRWLAWILGADAALGLALFSAAERGSGAAQPALGVSLGVSFLVAAVAGFAALVDGLRALVPWVGGCLARARRPWAIAAGDGLRTHRRLFTYASVSMALGTALWVGLFTEAAFRAIRYDVWSGLGSPPAWGLGNFLGVTLHYPGVLAMVIGTFAAATLVAVVVSLSSRRALAADDATRAALGLSRAHERLAAGVRQWAPMVVGIAVGTAIGWLLPLGLRLLAAIVSPNVILRGAGWNLTVAGYGLAAAAEVAAIALVVSLLGAVVVGATTPRGTLVEAARRLAKVTS